MDYIVKLEEFEGPLDLLLHLIKQSEVDIWDLNVSEITTQYLGYIKMMEDLELEIASEFLVMAAELIHLKSLMLLPKPIVVDDEYEEDPREALINRLIEYKKYKEVTPVFEEMNEIRQLIFTKAPSDLSEYRLEEAAILEEGIEIYDLLSAFQKMLNRQKLDNLQTRITHSEITIDDRIDYMVNVLNIKKRVEFCEIFEEFNKTYIVVTFLALLELAKRDHIIIEQRDNFDDLHISLKGVEVLA